MKKILLVFISFYFLSSCNIDNKFSRQLGKKYTQNFVEAVKIVDSLIFDYSKENEFNSSYKYFLKDFFEIQDSITFFFQKNEELFDSIRLVFNNSGFDKDYFFTINSIKNRDKEIVLKYFSYHGRRKEKIRENELIEMIPTGFDSIQLSNRKNDLAKTTLIIPYNPFNLSLKKISKDIPEIDLYLIERSDIQCSDFLLLDYIFLNEELDFNFFAIRSIIALELIYYIN